MASRTGPLASVLLSVAVIAMFVLVWGGIVLIRRGERTKGVLMIVCAVVVLGNVLIWTV